MIVEWNLPMRADRTSVNAFALSRDFLPQKARCHTLWVGKGTGGLDVHPHADPKTLPNLRRNCQMLSYILYTLG